MRLREALSTFRGHRVPHFELIKHRQWWFALSGLFIVLSLVGLLFRGLNFSIEFRGGSQLTFPDRSGASVGDYQAIMSRFGLPDAEIELVGGADCANQCVNIKTRSLTDLGLAQPTASATPSSSATPSPAPSASSTPSAGASSSPSAGATTSPSPAASPTAGGGFLPTFRGDQLRQALARTAGISTNLINEDDVGPTWGATISRKAVVGLVFFLILVTIYISFRFELKMAAGALIALLHDLIITAGIYALVGREVTPETVIAILTILGYSLYDTVVIFDKVKENTENSSMVARDTYGGVVNMSLNQTLMRSVNTSLVVLLPIGALLLFGGQTLKDFAFALFIGVSSGAYSSIFIAAPALALLKESEPRYQEIRRRFEARQSRPGLRTAPAGQALSAGAGGGGADRAAGGNGEAGTRRQPATSQSRPSAGSRSGSSARKKKAKPQGKPKRRRR